ncbi:MAG TPA: SRPBCC domain-containing protein [Fimbriimonadaceae bacterium]|nr:SRPBCC domain-containing protein [Fimbriimonadaceae bacterium]
MVDVSPNSSILRLTGDFGGFTPTELFDHWVKPELLVKWWPREAEVDPRVGGAYKFSWPDQNWRLEGVYTAFEPGASLGFTWAWNFDAPEAEPLQVRLAFAPSEHGTTLTLEHRSWDQTDAAQQERQGILEGWIHFGMRLAGLHRGDAT